MRVVVLHFHLRPGGVRRLIELATPHLVRHFGGTVEAVTVATGEMAGTQWRQDFESQLGRTPVDYFIEPAFRYLSEQRRGAAAITRQLRRSMAKLFAGQAAGHCVVWAHNLGVGRNLLLARELIRACEQRGIRLVSHHHDWWFDNRWRRWSEMRRLGLRTPTEAARTILSAARCVRHVAINQADARILAQHLPGVTAWLPNLTEPAAPPLPPRLRKARRWLRGQLGGDAPVWILPCRLLRRKNIAEALLLIRWLRPEAWLITTGGVSSADEQAYAGKLAAAARENRWRLRLGILSGDESATPSVAELLAISEAVLLTSIQEGFGLPYLEAAAARRPLIARRLPNIASDLASFGFRFPQLYDDLLVDPRLYDWETERRRQRKLFQQWFNRLPRACQALVGQPSLLAARATRPVPFSRLTLNAQLEVLAKPPEQSWKLCVKLNPFLRAWQRRAAAGRLQITPWPRRAVKWLSGKTYAERFRSLIKGNPKRFPSLGSSLAAQEAFLREKLQSKYLFPLLWASDP